MSAKRDKPKNAHEVQYRIEERWLIDTIFDRQEEAVNRARDLLRDGDKDAVKVIFYRSIMGGFTKERVVFEETRADFMNSQPRINGNVEGVDYCEGTVDFYKLESRLMVRRIFAEWLDRFDVTTTELLHNWTYGKRMMDSGAALNTAVHKVATVQAKAADMPMRSRIAQIEQHIRRISSRAREHQQWVRSSGVKVNADSANTVADKLFKQMDAPAARHRLTALICDWLAPQKSVGLKLQAALELSETAKNRELLSILDEVMADCIIVPAVLKEVFGAQPSLAAFLIELCQVLGDNWQPNPQTTPELKRLVKFINAGIASQSTRRVLLERLVAELESDHPLDRRDPESEPDWLSTLGAEIRGETGGRRIVHDNIKPALDTRKVRQRVHALRELGMEDAANELLRKLRKTG
ncbi:MAG: hypothetical protein Alpg2KO_19340 [Alphaproteobacteria bacterium]